MVDLRVLVIADDPLARAGLATLLAEPAGLVVAGRASSVDDLRAAIAIYRPDVIVWDLGWTPAAVLARLSDLETRIPSAALLPNETAAAPAWAAGARGLLRRDIEPAQLAAALTALAHDLAVVDPAFAVAWPVSSRTANEPAAGGFSGAAPTPPVEALTARELEVLRLLAEGLANKVIATRLNISEHTVKFHVNAILGKLGVASRTEAVVRATRLGLILL